MRNDVIAFSCCMIRSWLCEISCLCPTEPARQRRLDHCASSCVAAWCSSDATLNILLEDVMTGWYPGEVWWSDCRSEDYSYCFPAFICDVSGLMLCVRYQVQDRKTHKMSVLHVPCTLNLNAMPLSSCTRQSVSTPSIPGRIGPKHDGRQ